MNYIAYSLSLYHHNSDEYYALIDELSTKIIDNILNYGKNI